MTLLYLYLGSCVGCYAASCFWNKLSFKDATFVSILLGLLGTLIWPIVLGWLWLEEYLNPFQE